MQFSKDCHYSQIPNFISSRNEKKQGYIYLVEYHLDFMANLHFMANYLKNIYF